MNSEGSDDNIMSQIPRNTLLGHKHYLYRQHKSELEQLLDVTHLWPASCCMDGMAKKLFRECEAAEDKSSYYCNICKQAGTKICYMHTNTFPKVQS